MSSSYIPKMNLLYLAFVVVAGTTTLVFIGWAITSQVYSQWSHGQAISGGFNWPIVFCIDGICVLAIGALYWKVFRDAHTEMTPEGISQPSLRGTKTILWQEVTAIQVHGGVGYHVCAGVRKIVLSPYAYSNPASVIETLRSYASIHWNKGPG